MQDDLITPTTPTKPVQTPAEPQSAPVVDPVATKLSIATRVKYFLEIAAFLISIIALWVSIYSNNLTQRALELSAEPVVSIFVDKNRNNENDEIDRAIGLFPADKSILKLVVRNESPATIEQATIRMTLWELYINKADRHLTVCPFGYVYGMDSPNFKITNLLTDNVLTNKTRFSLKQSEEYPFNLDFSKLKNVTYSSENSRILLKIDVNFVKSIGKTSHSDIKLYILDPSNDVAIDVVTAPEFSFPLADKKNELQLGQYKVPSLVYPFIEQEFLDFFSKPTYRLDFPPFGCTNFSLLKKERVIIY